ncbi:MAG TPA: lysophospholipid acyltransferase family protein [Pseudonocardiaceae bacterium]|nr:lysophospholipid acyltransferase family protein [Pseudonocardiaceae bacterium]
MSRSDVPPGTLVWLEDFCRWLFPWLMAIVVRRRVHGRERVPATGPVVLVANHSSMLDGPVIASALSKTRRPVFLIKREMFFWPVGSLLKWIGQVPISRNSVDRAPLFTAVQVLRGGGLIGVFPEGTRGAGDVAQVHSGAAWLARAGAAVVLPVACRGTFRAPGVRRRWRPRVDVLIGEPLPVPEQRGRAGLATATEQVRAVLAATVTELDRLRAGAAPDSKEWKVEST